MTDSHPAPLRFDADRSAAQRFDPARFALPVNAMLLVAARSWRAARDARAPVQPSLARALGRYDCPMLAPVLDSLMRFYEDALGRPVMVGAGPLHGEGVTGDGALTLDERLLLGLLDGSRPRHACIDCPPGAATRLDCAICCTRIMIALAAPRGRLH